MLLEPLEDRRLLAAIPSATLDLPAEPFIGETVNFTVTFDNLSAADAGYGPFIDLIFPVNGADGAGNTSTADGLDFDNATYLGTPVTATELPFPGTGAGPSCVTHPYAVDTAGLPLQVCGTPGDKLVVLQLPFGSFTATQPAATISVAANMSNYADLGTPLNVITRAGFQFGNDPLNNPSAPDPTILGPDPDPTKDADSSITNWTTNASVTPTLITLDKVYSGPEDETATGPNFPRQYTIQVEIADGQTVTDLDVTDLLPNNLAFLSLISATPAGYSVTQTPTVGAAANSPDNDLVVTFTSITGATGAGPDATVTFEYFVPLNDANGVPVINAASGDDVISENQASAVGDWTPLDGRDPGGTNNAVADPAGPEHILTDKSIAIQKSVVIQNDVGAAGASPGDTLEYTYQFQVSDYFAFQNLIVNDILSDGQRFDTTFSPTLAVTEHGSTSPTSAIDSTNFNVYDRFTGGVNADPTSPPIDGTQRFEIRVSNELVTRSLDARLLGGCIPTAGTGSGNPPDCSVFNGGATTATVVYRSVIQNVFTDDFGTGTPSVDQGDELSNAVSIAGDLLTVTDASTPTGQSEADTSGAGVAIVTGDLAKSIYAINGSTTLPSPLQISPGDQVTYRLIVTKPLSRFENGALLDYLPLPIFDATTVTSFDPTVSADAPPSGQAKYGPTDTFQAITGAPAPTLSTDATANSVVFTFGDFAAVPPQVSQIDLLFTVTASAAPFADGLFLTNQARSIIDNTAQTEIVADDIIQIRLGQPVLDIQKGVVSTNNAAGTFSPPTVGPAGVTFALPASSPSFTGTIHSNGLAANPINSNLNNVDAADLVTFVIVVENTGTSRTGAFDIQVRDSLPAGFTIPGGGLNLQVRDGTGALINYTAVTGTDPYPLFGDGIELEDPGPTLPVNPPTDNTDAGALDQYNATSGRNILIVTYDLQAETSVQPSQTITNTATLFNYAGSEGGIDHTTTDLTDDAAVTIAPPSLTKILVGTNFNTINNANDEAVIGELIEYQVAVDFPEGITPAAVVRDTLDLGLEFVSLVGILVDPVSAPLATTVGAGDFSDPASFTPTVSGDGISTPQTLTFDLGTVTNSDTDNTITETLVLTYRVRVLNTAINQDRELRNNSATFNWTSDGTPQVTAPSSAADVTIIEPALQINKSAVVDGSGTVGQAGSTVVYTMVIDHSASTNTDAYDVTFSDSLPAELVFTPRPVLP